MIFCKFVYFQVRIQLRSLLVVCYSLLLTGKLILLFLLPTKEIFINIITIKSLPFIVLVTAYIAQTYIAHNAKALKYFDIF
jgi:hypothetical protein